MKKEMKNYEIKNEKDQEVGDDILVLYYGGSWESVLDRLGNSPNGHVITIHHHGNAYKVYRRLKG